MRLVPLLTRPQIEEAMMRMLAPAYPHRFRNWLRSLSDDVLCSEFEAVTGPLVPQTIPDDRILEPQDLIGAY